MKKSDIHILVFAAMTLVLGGALEELLPRFCGVGFPVLLAVSDTGAARRSFFAAVLFAAVAGAFEDALSGLPALTGVVFFILAVLLVRSARFGRFASALTFPLCQIWTWLWVSDVGGSVFVRLLVAAPLGLVTSYVADIVIRFVERRFALVD